MNAPLPALILQTNALRGELHDRGLALARLLEHQAKGLLERAGVLTPRREVANTRDEVLSAASRLGGRVVVKALVPSNRRAKDGGVRFADDPEAAARAAEEILGRVFNGRRAESVADRGSCGL